MELIKQVAFYAKLSKSSEADIVPKEHGLNQSWSALQVIHGTAWRVE